MLDALRTIDWPLVFITLYFILTAGFNPNLRQLLGTPGPPVVPANRREYFGGYARRALLMLLLLFAAYLVLAPNALGVGWAFLCVWIVAATANLLFTSSRIGRRPEGWWLFILFAIPWIGYAVATTATWQGAMMAIAKWSPTP